MIGHWQPEAVLVAACLAAAAWLARRQGGARWAAAALVVLAVAATLGGLLFAGLAPGVGPAHDAASRAFATLGFAIVAVVLVGGARWPVWLAVGATLLLALAGLAVPLAPVVLLAHAVAVWRSPSRRLRQAVALVAIAAVIVGQLVVPAGMARLDTLHLTLALWALALAAALG